MKTETLENVASWLAGAAAAAFFTFMFVAMSGPTTETVLKFLS